jgi:hypothetical protein
MKRRRIGASHNYLSMYIAFLITSCGKDKNVVSQNNNATITDFLGQSNRNMF